MRRPKPQTLLFSTAPRLEITGGTEKRQRRDDIEPRVERVRQSGRAKPWETRKSSGRRRVFLLPFAKPVTEQKTLMTRASLILFLTTLAWSTIWSAELLRTDSDAPYVHRINLYDRDDVVIGPSDSPAMPYSPKATCSQCHDYSTISHGWHFNAADPDVPAGRPSSLPAHPRPHLLDLPGPAGR